MKLAHFILALLLSVGVSLAPHFVRANALGTVIYAPKSSTEFMAYPRVIRLQHAGRVNGTLLATFEHWHSDGTPTPFVIERSTDDGHSWQQVATVFDGEHGPGHPWPTMFQPFLFELPTRLGRYSAGTLLLAGNVCPAGVGVTHFQLWRSTDHGTHWAYVNTFQTGGGGNPGRGIWEPFLALDKSGALLCYFSDERQYGTYSQFLGHIVSTDGGDIWGPEVRDVASPHQPDRPGMATVARLHDGTYLMSYEVCGPHGCEVHVKASSDGDTWGSGPDDLGVRPETTDGRYLTGTPYLTWVSGGGPEGRVLLTGHFETRVGGGPGPENGQVILINTHAGKGPWAWMPSPFRPVMAPLANTQPNYSPCLLPAADGRSLRLTVASGGTGFGQERTETATAGALPYADPFAGGTDAGWMDYGGDWSVNNGVYSDTACGVGDKAVAGSTGWTDYTYAADVKLTSEGQAGLLVRVTNPSVGADALSGYYIGLASDSGILFLGREDSRWTPLVSRPFPGGVSMNTWYHLQVTAHGSDLTVSARRTDGPSPTAALHVVDSHFPAGEIGLRVYDAMASWRHIRVMPAETPP